MANYIETKPLYATFDFSLQNAIMCVMFGLALLSGGIASGVYAADNSDLHDSICGFSSSGGCGDLETVYQSEAATAVSSGNSYLL